MKIQLMDFINSPKIMDMILSYLHIITILIEKYIIKLYTLMEKMIEGLKDIITRFSRIFFFLFFSFKPSIIFSINV